MVRQGQVCRQGEEVVRHWDSDDRDCAVVELVLVAGEASTDWVVVRYTASADCTAVWVTWAGRRKPDAPERAAAPE